jgi:hypothetical protein
MPALISSKRVADIYGSIAPSFPELCAASDIDEPRAAAEQLARQRRSEGDPTTAAD